MIESISSTNENSEIFKNVQSKTFNVDVTNTSLNELQGFLRNEYNNKKIMLKDMLPFMPLKFDNLSESIGVDVRNIKTPYSIIWDNPNKKVNMIDELEKVLTEQKKLGSDNKSLDFTKNAIKLLEKYSNQNSFYSILKDQIDS